MSDSISRNQNNSYEMETPRGSGAAVAQPPQGNVQQDEFDALSRAEQGNAQQSPVTDARANPPADPRSIDTNVSTNPFRISTTRQHAADAAQADGEGPNIHDKDVTVARGEALRFGSVSGNTVVRNAGRVSIGRVVPGGHLALPENTGRVRIKDNDGHLETEDNRKTINVTNNNNDMAAYENKGLIKVGTNRGDFEVGDETRAGISQGRPGWLSAQRENGRITVGANPGNLTQHYGSGSLGSVLHVGGPTEVSTHGAVKMTPSGPGGKLASPVVRGAGATLVAGAGVATTYAVGGANSIGLFNGAKDLAHPPPTAAMPTSTHGLSGTTAPVTVAEHIPRATGLSTPANTEGHAADAHVSVPDIKAIR